MLEQFHDNTRSVMDIAHQEARQVGSNQIDPEHLLLGIVRSDQALGTRLRLAESAIRMRLEVKTGTSTDAALPLSLAAKQVISLAADAAGRLNHAQIAPIHLLMGLLQDKESVASEILKSHGVTLEQVRALALALPAPGSGKPKLQ